MDALRVYVAQTAIPETVMMDIMNYGMGKNNNEPSTGRMTVAVMLALPALILPVLITPKRNFVVKSVMEALSNKMVQITYQEIALKILLKIKEMVGPHEFAEYMPMNVKKDFDLLCKVYGLPKSPSFRDSGIDLHIPSDTKRNWASKFVPKRDSEGNAPSSHAPVNFSGNMKNPTKCHGGEEPSTAIAMLERTPSKSSIKPASKKLPIIKENNSLYQMSMPHESSESDSSNSNINVTTNHPTNHVIENSRPHSTIKSSLKSEKNCDRQSSEKPNYNDKNDPLVNGKVIMETEIKISPETAVTMRILEQNGNGNDESEDESSSKRIVTDFSAPYPITSPNRSKSVMRMNIDDSEMEDNELNYNSDSEVSKRTPRRVRFGGEIVKMRTPDSDTVDQSDVDNNNSLKKSATSLSLPVNHKLSNYSTISNGNTNGSSSSSNGHHNGHHHNEMENDGQDNSSENSSDSSTENEYIKPQNLNAIPKSKAMKNSVYSNEIQSELKMNSKINNSARNKQKSHRDDDEDDDMDDLINSKFDEKLQMKKAIESEMFGQINSIVNQNNSRENSVTKSNNSNSKSYGSPVKSSFNKKSVEFSSGNEHISSSMQNIRNGFNETTNSFSSKRLNLKLDGRNREMSRPATSPAMPSVHIKPPTSSSNSSKNNSPIKSTPSTPLLRSPCYLKPRSKSMSPDRSRRLSTPTSPRVTHREITMLHNLQRSPISSPLRSRRSSFEECHKKYEEGTQTNGFIKSDEMTQTPNHYSRLDEMTQTSLMGDLVNTKLVKECSQKEKYNYADKCYEPVKESFPVVTYTTWEELGIVDYDIIKHLKSGVSFL